MIIDVPVLIAIDCQNSGAMNSYTSKQVVTMRCDTENTDAPTSYTIGYPPKPNATWMTDPISLWDLVYGDAWTRLKKRAERWPVDYCADEAEGTALQETVDADMAANGQSGVGA